MLSQQGRSAGSGLHINLGEDKQAKNAHILPKIKLPFSHQQKNHSSQLHSSATPLSNFKLNSKTSRKDLLKAHLSCLNRNAIGKSEQIQKRHQIRLNEFKTVLKGSLSELKRQRRLKVNMGKGDFPGDDSEDNLITEKENYRQSFDNKKFDQDGQPHGNNMLYLGANEGSNNPHQESVLIREISTKIKPPHRYKTSMGYYRGNLFLYGGLGCQRGLTWAQLDLKLKQWIFPRETNTTCISYDYSPITPIYGHSINLHRESAYIYGGTSSDTLFDLTIVNLKSKKIVSGAKAPYRRKQHASVIMGGKYLIIHGGVESGSCPQARKEMFYYNIETLKWDVVNGHNYLQPNSLMTGTLTGNLSVNTVLPALSHHKIVATDIKTKKKIRRFGDLCLGAMYIFGGKGEQGKCSNKLYKVRVKDEKQVSVEQILYQNNPNNNCIPEPRHSFCFQQAGNSHILLYGGRTNDEENQKNKSMGIFNDLFLFHIEKQIWIRTEISQPLGFRYGMASTTSAISNGQNGNSGKVYIFGGCGPKVYCNATITVLKVCEPGHQFQNSSLSSMKKIQDEENGEDVDKESTVKYDREPFQ